MKKKRPSFFPIAILASLGLTAAIVAVFWLAPNRLVQVHAGSVHWNGADAVDIKFQQDPQNPIVRVDLLEKSEMFKTKASERVVTRSIAVASKDTNGQVHFNGLNDAGQPALPGLYVASLQRADGPSEQTIQNKATETVMGYSSKIFYFHVGSAMVFLMCFIGCALLSIAYLVLRRSKAYGAMAISADYAAYAMAEIGVLFSFIVLITGPIWAKPNWGVFWTWEPRLLLTLLTSFLFIGYLVLRNYAGSDDSGRRMSAGVAVIGLPAAYFIHMAVELWGGNHPKVLSGGGLHGSDISTTFSIAVSAIFLYAGYLIALRVRTHRLKDTVEELFLDLSELEDRPS